MAGTIGSFKLKRGYVATFAQQENGQALAGATWHRTATSKWACFPPPWTTSISCGFFHGAGRARRGSLATLSPGEPNGGTIGTSTKLHARPGICSIRQTRCGPLDQDWKITGSNQLLGYNEPDQADQANMTVADADRRVAGFALRPACAWLAGGLGRRPSWPD